MINDRRGREMFGEEFTASDGLRVRHNPKTGYFEYFKGFSEGWTQVAPLGETAQSMVALGEFFQAKRDKELGRWRWTNPDDGQDYLVRELGYDSVIRVTSESTLETLDWTPEQYEGFIYKHMKPVKAILAYLETRPTPKPWHDAKQNELWELTIQGGITAPEVYRFAHDTTCADSKVFRPVNYPQRVWFDARDKRIESARRIYPESE